MKIFFKKTKIFLIAFFLLLPIIYYLYIYNNFHTVIKNEVYRSKQLNKAEFIFYIKKYKIKSILNLRGYHPDTTWYKNEIESTKELNVTHYDYGISALHYCDVAQINNIISIITNAPKPILIHCRAGSDRTGLISAVYLYAVAHKSYKEASDQLSIKYGHFPYLGNDTIAMDKSFENYIFHCTNKKENVSK